MTARVMQATDQQGPLVADFSGVGCMPDDGCTARCFSQKDLWDSVGDSAVCEGLGHAQPAGCWASGTSIRSSSRESPTTSWAMEDSDSEDSGEPSTCMSMHGRIRTYDSLDEFLPYAGPGSGQGKTSGSFADFWASQPCVASNFPSEPGSMASMGGWYSTSQTDLDSSDESSNMTSQSQDEASHAASNSRLYKAKLFSRQSSKSTAAHSDSLADEDEDEAWNEFEEQSSNGVSQPDHGMYLDHKRMRAPQDRAYLSGKKGALRSGETTTLMIQNLPRRCTRAMIAAEIDRSGFAASFDFVYVPTMFQPDRLDGYAFVNFLNQDMAISFTHAWNGSKRFQTSGRPTKVRVVKARVQGLQANLAKWTGERSRLVRVKNPNCRPLMPKAD